MIHAAVVAGPGAVAGPGIVDPELVRTALDAVDDRLAVYDDRIVTVRELWCRVAEQALGERADRVTLVVPSRWPGSRVELVEDALLTLSAAVTVLRRGDVLRRFAPVVVELGPDSPSVEEVIESVSGATTVVLDTPAGVGGLDSVTRELERRLERRGVEVLLIDDDGVRMAARSSPQQPRPQWRPARVGAVACALTVAAALAGAALRSEPARSAPATTWVVEGRVAVEVPAEWAVERVVTGPGSARVQVMSPDGSAAVHITQAVAAPQETREGTARALDAALRRQPAGVFTDFNPDDLVAGRHAVSYREARSAVVDWTALVDGGIRIAIGCRDGSPEPRRTAVCERAIGSARTLGEIG